MSRIVLFEEKYRDDTVFQQITKTFLTLKEKDREIYDRHLKKVIYEVFIPLLRKDELFDAMFKGLMPAGSYTKNTKYGKPEEYDLDLVLQLPIERSRIKIDTNHDNHGFVKIQLDTRGSMNAIWRRHRQKLCSWLTRDGYLDQREFHSWMQSIFNLALNKLNKTWLTGYYEIVSDYDSYSIWHRKSGPAFTLFITTPEGTTIDVDLVLCLEFEDFPLENGYRPFERYGSTWMAVPKPLRDRHKGNILWRVSFYSQEKEILEGNVKPVIRMLKKFRDTKKWKGIASYYIETLFYHEIDSNKDLSYMRVSRMWLFITMLDALRSSLDRGYLPDFWHRKHNLFENMSYAQKKNYANHLKNLLTDIDSEISDNKFILAETVLTYKEVWILRIYIWYEKLISFGLDMMKMIVFILFICMLLQSYESKESESEIISNHSS